jgi:hypothetical protein
MRILGFGGGEFLKIGLAAVLFILFAKWLAPKTGVPALAAVANRV